MSGNNDWFQSSRVPSFAQMLKKNLPVQPSAQTVTTSTGYSSESYSLSNMASKVTQVTGTNSFTFVIMPKFYKILGCPVSFDELPVSLFPDYISIYLWPCPNWNLDLTPTQPSRNASPGCSLNCSLPLEHKTTSNVSCLFEVRLCLCLSGKNWIYKGLYSTYLLL